MPNDNPPDYTDAAQRVAFVHGQVRALQSQVDRLEQTTTQALSSMKQETAGRFDKIDTTLDVITASLAQSTGRREMVGVAIRFGQWSWGVLIALAAYVAGHFHVLFSSSSGGQH